MNLHICGVVQGVGFRPFVYRAAQQHDITGWVLNDEDGVHVVAEGTPEGVDAFVEMLRRRPPPAAQVSSLEVTPVPTTGFTSFEIRESAGGAVPTVRISPDIAVCDDCLRELFDPADRRFGYPYINCTNCGPRYSIILGLPYDRPRTTMREWPLCEACQREYDDPSDRRFHAQPVACPACGPAYSLEIGDAIASGPEAIARTAALLADGALVAVKGIGGYHLACDAQNTLAVANLRARKYRKERPFAVMARDLAVARTLVDLDQEAEDLLTSVERPIVLARAKRPLPGVAPHNRDLGVMLPYTPLHHLLFAAGAPAVLVMTSANRSSEPIAYLDPEARTTLSGIADAFLVGERPIARRIDDAIVRVAPAGRVVLRRARGLAPRAVARLPSAAPILAVGGDLKNAVTLVIDGQAFAGQHIGDLAHLSAQEAFERVISDLCAMYDVRLDDLFVAHDAHPEYRSSLFARALSGNCVAVQHHRAHIASVLAEREAWNTAVVGFAFDGTGYGDDGTIWGGEVFGGTLADGLERVAHLRPAMLAGGDAAARFPVQAAAGFLAQIDPGVRFDREPFCFLERYAQATALIARDVRSFRTTSIGRLFDTVAALAGFTSEQTFEGQAAMWLEHLARSSGEVEPYPLAFENAECDFRPALRAIVADRLSQRAPGEIARAFHAGVARAIVGFAKTFDAEAVVVSGGVFQNALLVEFLLAELGDRLWFNTAVPPNDGGLSLGQAALAALSVAGRQR